MSLRNYFSSSGNGSSYSFSHEFVWKKELPEKSDLLFSRCFAIMCSSSFSLVASMANSVTILRKMPSEIKVAPRYKLLTLLTLLTLLILLT